MEGFKMQNVGKIILVAAMGEKKQIWNGNRFPWGDLIPADMRRFRGLTKGPDKNVALGRVTCEAIIVDGFWPLSGRKELIVMTRDLDFTAEGARIVHSKDEILKLSKTEDVYIIGGAEMYAMFEPHASEMELTIVEGDFPGTIYFPDYDKHAWKEKHPSVSVPKGIDTDFPLKFVSLRRISPTA